MGASTIFAIGSTLVLILFGYRWFSSQTVSKTWPPNVNMCPDYLTFVPNVSGSSSASKGGCVDLLGVSRGGLLQTLPSDVSSINSAMTTKLFEYTAKDVSAATGAASLQRICDRCKATGITWEGVYDGDSCTAIKTVDAKNAALSRCVASV